MTLFQRSHINPEVDQSNLTEHVMAGHAQCLLNEALKPRQLIVIKLPSYCALPTITVHFVLKCTTKDIGSSLCAL